MAEKKKSSKKYIEAIGRRKTSVARVRLFKKKGKITINEKDFDKYFPTFEMQQIVTSPLKKLKVSDDFSFTVKVKGGGIHSQAEAVKHGISRALVQFDPELRKKLKKGEFLTRDARMRERKKFGLKRARRAPQWKKR